MQVPLLPRIANGETAAIDECLDRYGGLVWSLARRLSPSLSDAEDAVQEIFLDVWKNANRFREEVASEVTFVAMLARRRLVSRMRQSQRDVGAQPIDESTLQYASPPQPARLDITEEATQATACLERLKRDERQVLELSIYHGLPQSQIATRIGLPLGSVKSHARRGLSQLRDCMRLRSRVNQKREEQ
ncbi:MAG: sigma-70 family RNA polymerase sigma factor [Planctomycetota bacterium]|nr:MAG: sigma-70 family RNA polymerase sigma factor [Planctomycetota bacterium]